MLRERLDLRVGDQINTATLALTFVLLLFALPTFAQNSVSAGLSNPGLMQSQSGAQLKDLTASSGGTGNLGQFNINNKVNPKSPAYGAKGDGTTDDTAAITAAMTAAGASGELEIPAGRYSVSSLTLTQSGLRILCDQGATFTRRTTGQVALLQIEAPTTVIGCTFDNTGAAGGDDAPIVIRAGGSGTVIKGGAFINLGLGSGIEDFGSSVQIAGNTFSGSDPTNGGSVIWLRGSNTSPLNDILVDGNNINSTSANGDDISVVGGENHIIIAHNLMQTARMCVETGNFSGSSGTSPTDLIIVGNSCVADSNSSSMGYSLADGSNHITFTGNIFDASGFHSGNGIELPDTNYASVVGNTVLCGTECTALSIGGGPSSNIVVSGNYLNGAQTYNATSSSRLAVISVVDTAAILQHIQIENNQIVLPDNTGTGTVLYGIWLQSPGTGDVIQHFDIRGNTIVGGANGNSDGVLLEDETGVGGLSDISIDDNKFQNVTNGIATLNTAGTSASLADNEFNAVTEPLHILRDTSSSSSYFVNEQTPVAHTGYGTGGISIFPATNIVAGSKVYCSDCQPLPTCPAGGSGAVGTFIGGSWQCGTLASNAGVNFANFPSAVINGASFYCPDCDPPANPPVACTSAGAKTGAWVHGINGAWVCSY